MIILSQDKSNAFAAQDLTIQPLAPMTQHVVAKLHYITQVVTVEPGGLSHDHEDKIRLLIVSN